MACPDPVTAAGEHTVRHGDHTAVLTPVAAGIRVLRHGDLDLVVPYEAGQVRPHYRGAVVAPWPNRVVDGRYAFAGTEYRLPLTEPARLHALHGLVAWTRFELMGRDEASVAWSHRTVAQIGYPWTLHLEVTHALGDAGLTTSVTATNLSDSPAPYGVAPHPYLRVGDVPLDECRLQAPGASVLQVTEDRLVPQGLVAVGGTPYDFRAPRVVADTEMDHAFTDLETADGQARVELRAPDGRGVACTWDAGVLPWLQLHTADVPGRPQHRAGLATEPMTCAPDAFNSGAGLVVLEPGGSHTAGWTLGRL